MPRRPTAQTATRTTSSRRTTWTAWSRLGDAAGRRPRRSASTSPGCGSCCATRQLVALRRAGVLAVPALLLQDGRVVKGLPGLLTLLARRRATATSEAVRWMFTAGRLAARPAGGRDAREPGHRGAPTRPGARLLGRVGAVRHLTSTSPCWRAACSAPPGSRWWSAPGCTGAGAACCSTLAPGRRGVRAVGPVRRRARALVVRPARRPPACWCPGGSRSRRCCSSWWCRSARCWRYEAVRAVRGWPGGDEPGPAGDRVTRPTPRWPCVGVAGDRAAGPGRAADPGADPADVLGRRTRSCSASSWSRTAC